MTPLDEALKTYVEIANEHRDAIEFARDLVAHGSKNAMATALVAVDEAMRNESERRRPATPVTDQALLTQALRYLVDLWDEGPRTRGWQSKRLTALVEELKRWTGTTGWEQTDEVAST